MWKSVGYKIFKGIHDTLHEAIGDKLKKTFDNTDAEKAKGNVPDIKFYGDAEQWKLICKASSENEGWMKSTKAMEIPGASDIASATGCLVQVTTQQRNPDGSYAVAEALTFVPGVSIEGHAGGGRKLVR